MIVFVDMDGVVADFDRHVESVYGKSMDDMTDTEKSRFWDAECVSYRFFANAPPIQEGISLVKSIEALGFDMAFFTSTGGQLQHVDIAKQKLDFLQRYYIGHLPVVFATGTKSKASFANDRAVLVDDREKVVNAFRANGGTAFLFTRDNWKEVVDSIIEMRK